MNFHEKIGQNAVSGFLNFYLFFSIELVAWKKINICQFCQNWISAKLEERVVLDLCSFLLGVIFIYFEGVSGKNCFFMLILCDHRQTNFDFHWKFCETNSSKYELDDTWTPYHAGSVDMYYAKDSFSVHLIFITN
jgi:hypothetical protein